ncbi:hypothetical protein NKR19_g647 [Coniochaeta hoffmannii]|uniref:Mitochondrial escape protein 2 n=1 Tax=Coniochaeta hoffmannii TaxID=91930 RepID=A0AA38SJV3_9PEZI|nr:hypothetical protein NKR19_g647 [Coniochaeta hoffmannii]
MFSRSILLRSPLRPCTSRSPIFAARCAPIGRGDGRAWETTITGDKHTGHIAASENEAILFIDNLFPLKFSPLFWRPWQTDRDLSDLLRKFDNSSLNMMDPMNLVKRAIPEKLPVKVTEIVPRLKDGGAYVKFSHPDEITAEEIEGTLERLLRERPVKPWFNPFRGVKAGLVQGVPWLEDLYRFPKTRVKVEFVSPTAGNDGVELSQETLYSLFRRYGKIAEITSQPPDSKILPKYAYVDFVLLRDSIMARNCMHGFTVVEQLGGGKNGTKLRLSYENRVKPHHIWDWVTNHPRIVIPLLAAFIATFTVIVFDPIREFFIKAHVQKSFQISNSRVYKWFKRQTSDIMSQIRQKKAEQAGLSALWTHRKDLIDDINNWLLETADTFIVVQGPRGSGKKDLVLDQVLKDRQDVLVVDCKPVVEARGEAGTIKHLASAVGYRPVFSWANNLSSLIDLAVQGTTGVKANFSETLESQISKILQTSAVALKNVALDGRSKGDKDAAISDDAYLEAHPEKRPVVVIDNFLHKNEETSLVYDKIAEWAAALVQSNIAHVIFLTNDTAYSKSLSKSLPDRVFRSVALGDLSPSIAKQYVVSHLDPDDQVLAGDQEASTEDKERILKEGNYRKDLKELDECIESLGGRLTDLEFLARRLKSGQSPKRAVAEIIEQSASEIIKMYFPTATGAAGGADKKWSAEQAWFLVSEIAKKESLRYNEVLLANTFASSTNPAAANGEAALESLANAELITVTTHKGRPQTIRAGKPVYQAAFNSLVEDRVLRAKMDLAVLTELAKVEAKGIEKVEQELGLLGQLPNVPYQTGERVTYLLNKLEGSQRKIQQFEGEMGELKKILATEA